MKVLLSAYSCLPGGGSEPGIGWNWAQCIAANGNDVSVITRSVNRTEIEKFTRDNAVEQVRFIFHDLPKPLDKIYKLPFGNYCFYFLWQYTAAERALKLHRTESFDLVQHITWGSFRVPSFMGAAWNSFYLWAGWRWRRYTEESETRAGLERAALGRVEAYD
jgi:hypothetical protein